MVRRSLVARILAGAVCLVVAACRPARPNTAVVQDCIQLPARLVVVPGLTPDEQLLAIDAAQTFTNPLTGKPAGIAELVVTVLDPVRRPIERAEVNIADTDRGRTGKDGRIRFRVLAPLEHEISISAPGMLPQGLALASRRGFVDSIRAYLTWPSAGSPCDMRR